MDLQTRKIHFVQEFLRLKNEKVIDKLEKLLRQEMKRVIGEDVDPLSIDEFNELIDRAEKDSDVGRLYTTKDIFSKSSTS